MSDKIAAIELRPQTVRRDSLCDNYPPKKFILLFFSPGIVYFIKSILYSIHSVLIAEIIFSTNGEL